MSAFLPSQVVLREVPLVGTMQKAEVEFAAALIVRTLAVRGDAWRPVAWSEIQEVIKAEMEADLPPFAKLLRNPFFRPDVHRLVKDGYAAWQGDQADEHRPVALTDKGIEALRRWVLPAAPAHGPVPTPEVH